MLLADGEMGMVVDDVIRAKGLGVVLDGFIREADSASVNAKKSGSSTARPEMDGTYYRARFINCRDGLQFSIAINVLLALWITWLMWRW
jgi:tetrahydromethanopterin S-methyltransferase subunit E